jgi:hypothetical protein
MRITKPSHIRIALLLVGLIALTSWLLFGRLTLFRTAEQFSSRSMEPIKLENGVKAGQPFVAHYPGLYRIDVLLTTFGHRDVPDLVFHLQADGPGGEELFTTSVDGAAIVDNAFQPFTFPPLDDSAGRRYFFYLESPGASQADALGVLVSSGDRDPEGSLYVTRSRETPANRGSTILATPAAHFTHKVFLPLVAVSTGPEGWLPLQDIGFTAHYKGRPLETILTFFGRLAANKPLLWGSPWFYLLLLVLYLVLLIWFTRVLRR